MSEYLALVVHIAMPSNPATLVSFPRHFHKLSLIVLLVLSLISGSCTNVLHNTLLFIYGFILVEILVRSTQLIEYFWQNGYSNDRAKEIAFHIFNFNLYATITFIVLSLIYWINNDNILLDCMQYLPLYTAYLFIKSIKIDESNLNKTLWVFNSEGLDYGSGMAYSFFYGYLNIILPNRGILPHDDNISNRMEQYEAREGVKFGLYKLIILIPKNLYCPPDISKLSTKNNVRMEVCKSLVTIRRNRAGVQEREYRNTVYKIVRTNTNDPFYLVIEGATPLLTLHESLKNANVHQKIYENNKDAIVMQFYYTLKKLLECNIEYKDLCELIYYDDDQVEDIGEFILEHLNL